MSKGAAGRDAAGRGAGAVGRSGVLAVARTAAAASVAAVVVLVAGLILGGSVTEKVIPGLGDAGVVTRWGLPGSRMVMDLAATLTIGTLLAAAVLLPLETARGGRQAAGARQGTGTLSADAVGYLRAASWTAAAWAAAAAANLVFTVADVLGQPVGEVVTGSELSSYVGSLPQGTALMLVVLLAVVVALLARTTTTPAATFGLLALAGAALLPPPLTGHSASAANHSVAVTGVALHVAAIAPWVGGLIVVAAHALLGRDRLPVMAERFSRMALWCYVTVGVSGFVNVISRLPDPAEMVDTDYGRLALGKIAAFAVLGYVGWWHRNRTLPALADRRPWAFTRLASAEVVVMASTVGLAVALARTAPPPPTGEETPVKALVGFDMPPELTAGRLAQLGQFDFTFAALVAVLGGVYLAGVVRLRRRGDSWPMGRTVSWFVGLLTILLVTETGVAKYSQILFSVHMVQHMVLNMLTPIFLVVGAPVTLALRALKPAAIRGDRGPREWLTAALHSRFTAIVAHPAVATVIFVAGTFVLYFTSLFESAMRNHLGHIAMTLHFLLAGSLFFWVLLGVDPAPKKLPYPGRLMLLFVTMPFHAFFGIALMNLSQPLARGWYQAVDPPWGGTVLNDQHNGGAIAWGFGEIPTFIVLIFLAFQWYFDDQRQARRLDRRADRAGAPGGDPRDDELAAYNARLAKLAERDRAAKGGGEKDEPTAGPGPEPELAEAVEGDGHDDDAGKAPS
ncbi:bifunctional copper resistance protein CopD/cytochrome c oxidase assembly protein [Actinomadura sp. NEAU-AAG7]|uniref:bifunctional copper resistance protein CopD/cytochrome c oxidase assembly protein n=1 Tax=Actinomadura sp. NEAU-AAG7 TaxID=2839640 RepID=UPI001BE4AEF1|nr:bifunctional copper resistance protein CopD/cytochrome c oxidase assembly protein [Actinomadura sp. NEAU-AAG7]MBT2209567.1 bifunctional copper resistance protein CopD/cytochrome c oxidase assembly protein [Actinomadura sp. NEAU-AAG7]